MFSDVPARFITKNKLDAPFMIGFVINSSLNYFFDGFSFYGDGNYSSLKQLFPLVGGG